MFTTSPHRSRLSLGLWMVVVFLPAAAGAQVPSPRQLSMDEAIQLALQHNEALLATRLTIDMSKADEVTAGLKPNPNVSFGASGFPLTSPRQTNGSLFSNDVAYSAGLGYTFERGGKREERMAVAAGSTDQTVKTVRDAERQLTMQVSQAFIDVLLANSTLDLARANLKDFTDVVEINRRRVAAGDLAEGDFMMISLQQLQFQQDVSAATLGQIQSRATLRQLVGLDALPEDFEVTGDLVHAKLAVTLDGLKQAALASRPDLLAAEAGVTVAKAQAGLEVANRARDVDGSVGYTRAGPDVAPFNNTLGAGVSIDLPIHDRNQGNIAHARIAVQQAIETEAAVRSTVITDVVGAFAQFQTADAIVALYDSGYLDQAKESLDISTYAYQRGAASLPTLLDAERTYRATQLAYRQALASYMASVQQLDFVVGKKVIP